MYDAGRAFQAMLKTHLFLIAFLSHSTVELRRGTIYSDLVLSLPRGRGFIPSLIVRSQHSSRWSYSVQLLLVQEHQESGHR